MALGCTKDEVMEHCPFELDYVFEAQKIRKKMDDQSNWELGIYIESAVATAVEHNLAGYKARSKYIEEPFSSKIDKDEKKLKDNNRLLMATLEAWATNWKMEHTQSEEVDNG